MLCSFNLILPISIPFVSVTMYSFGDKIIKRHLFGDMRPRPNGPPGNDGI